MVNFVVCLVNVGYFECWRERCNVHFSGSYLVVIYREDVAFEEGNNARSFLHDIVLKFELIRLGPIAFYFFSPN